MSDFRLAIRTLLKSRSFTAVAVTTLALGIGAATAIFTVVNGVLLRSLPYPDAGRLTMVWLANPRQGIEKDISPYPTFREFRAQSQAFSHLAAYTQSSMNLNGAGDPQRVRGAQVTSDFFAMLGVQPGLGRAFREDDHAANRPRVAVIGHGLWSRAFGGTSSVLGRTLLLNDTRYTIVGVMPRGFAYPRDTEFWLPLVPVGPGFEARGTYWLTVAGRLRPAAGLGAAAAELEAILRRLDREFPQIYTDQEVVLESLQESMTGRVRTPLLVLQGAVLLLLSIACANVANLLSVRATARRREIAIRAALGAQRGRIVRQLLIESVVLAVAGAAAGVVLAYWGVELLRAMGPGDLPRLHEVGVDAGALGFAALLAAASTLVFGLTPALQLIVQDLVTPLTEGGRAAGEQGAPARTRKALVAGQIALALMLLIAAGLLFRSFSRVMATDPGLDPDSVLAVELSLTPLRYPQAEQRAAFYRTLLERLSALPQVESAGAISTALLSRLPNSTPIAIEGRTDLSDADRNLPIAFDSVTPDFFRAVRIPIRAGRAFAHSDDASAPRVAIVNEALVRRFFSGRDPIGRRVTFGDPASPNVRWMTIVGVAGDVRRSGLDLPPRPELYMAYPQQSRSTMTLTIRTAGEPTALAGAVRSAVAAIDPQLPVARMETLDRLIGDSLAQRRFNMLLLMVFSLLALSLSAVGIYGVVAYTVSRRSHEFGVRLALGARRADMVRIVLGEAALVTVAGTLIGVAGALALTRVLATLLFEISPTDAATFIAVTLALAAVALLACYIPARRATRIDPIVSMRAE